MDPLTALLVAMWIAGHFTKNVTQDLAWKARGEDPPSFRREQARRANGTSRRPFTERREARRFWVNAWEDAWENADARRARRHDRKAERLREKWELQDEVERAEKQAHDRNRALDAAEDAAHDRNLQLEQCEQCGTAYPESELTAVVVDGQARWRCRTCAAKAIKPSAQEQYPKCWRCGRLTSAPQNYYWRGMNCVLCRPCHRHLVRTQGVDVPPTGDGVSAPRVDTEVVLPEDEHVLDPPERPVRPRPGTSEFCPHCVAWRDHDWQGRPVIVHERHCLRNIPAFRPEDAAREDGADPPADTTSDNTPDHAPDDASAQARTGEPPPGRFSTDKEANDPLIPGTARTTDPPAPAKGEAQVIQFSTWRRDHPAPDNSDRSTASTTNQAPVGAATAASAAATVTEESMSAESQTLSQAIAFTNGMATSASAAFSNTELSLTGLRTGGVSGEALNALEQAMEAMQQAQAAYQRANAVLINHLAVREAYEANQGAGSREYVTQD
ncbi:hypothetical protein [Actinomadura rupiterrae]|uniref:hypothetical protein n=1 Tax=Actinomadura rupiterrae TaxID=559627 RepID=UPI0020A3C3E0|nr:hypothetical protein [Actinomadura rupiterrae]MCP2340189.1 hypothetical protein [Actinomadura rupiterrae]